MADEPHVGFWTRLYDFWATGCNDDLPCAWYVMAGVYGLLAIVTLVQLIRIQVRLQEFGWTMQKAFHLLNFFVCLFRGLALVFWNEVDKGPTKIVLFDVPGLLFFTTYTLLVLFWAEIVHGDRPKMTLPPRIYYIIINVSAYVVMAVFWIVAYVGKEEEVASAVSTWFQFILNLFAATVFIVYGSLLLQMLNKSPVHTMVRHRKIVEVGVVTGLAAFCFLGKAILEIISGYYKRGLDYQQDLLLNFLFYAVCEVMVIASALGMLSGMPPKRRTEGYQPVPETA